MILVLDVGNTNIVLGVFQNKTLLKEWRLSTDFQRTADEYGIQVMNLFNLYDFNPRNVEGVIVSSVVPNIMYSLERMINKYFKLQPIIVGPGIKTGINIKYDNPKEVGADRIVNAVAAHELYKKPLIIVDFGTATTYCAIRKNGDYLGGVICPGIKISSDALTSRAAKLPRVELSRPDNVIGKNTISAMQSGLVFGYIGSVDYLVDKIKSELLSLGEEEPIVVATGGFAKLISEDAKSIDVVNPFLTLEGLRILYDKNKE